MDILSQLSPQESDSISPENFNALKLVLTQRLAVYDNVVYPADSIKEAKQDKAELNKMRRSIEERRKEIRRNCLEPYTAVEPRFKELVALIDQPLSRINQYIIENSPPVSAEEDAVIGYQILKMTGTPEQMAALRHRRKNWAWV